MPDLLKLFPVNGLAGDVAKALPYLPVLETLATHWRDVARELWQAQASTQLDTPEKCLAFLLEKLDDPVVAAVFAKLDLNSLLQQLKDVAGKATDGTGVWGKLLSPVSGFGEAYTGAVSSDNDGYDAGDGKAISLALPELAEDGGGQAGAVALTFDVSANAALDVEPGALWPFPKDAVAPGLLRIGAAGALHARGGATLPFGSLGQGSVAADAGIDSDFSLFYRPFSDNTPVASALVKSLAALPDPFDLNSISHCGAFAQLEGVLMRFRGSATAGLSLVLGKAISVSDLVSGNLGLSVSLSYERAANWLLSLRRLEDGSMRFVVSRDREAERQWAVGVGLALDASGLVTHLHQALVDASGSWGAHLDQIKPYLSPGTMLRGLLKDKLATAAQDLAGDDALRAAVIADAGLLLDPQQDGAESQIVTFLEDRLARAFDAGEASVLETAETGAAKALDELVDLVPALAGELRPKAQVTVSALAGQVVQSFEAALGTLIPGVNDAHAVNDELKAIGLTVGQGASDVDKAVAGVRDLVGRATSLLQTLVDKTKDAARFKLSASIGWDGTDSAASHYEIMGTIRRDGLSPADQAPLDAMWRALSTGQFEPVQRLFGAGAAIPAGLALDPGSSLARTASRASGFTAALMLVDFQLSVRDIVSGTATITRTAGGDIGVQGKGEASHTVSNLNESRTASFISIWDLLRRRLDPRAGGTFNLSLQLDHDDDNLKPEEVKGLLSGCASLGLIADTRIAAAERIYQGWTVAAAASGKKPQGRISLAMVLPSVAVDRMLALGRKLRGETPALDRALFGQVVEAMLATGYRTAKQIDADARDAREDYPALAGVSDPVQVMFLLRDRMKELQHINDDGGPLLSFYGSHYGAFLPVIRRTGTFAGWIEAGVPQPGLLESMANIFDSVPLDPSRPVPGAWDEKTYVDAGRYLAWVTMPWLHVNAAFGKISDQLDPLFLAFMLLLARFASPDAPAEVEQVLDAKVDPIWADRLFQLTMTPRGGDPVAVG